jgi:cytochrome b561
VQLGSALQNQNGGKLRMVTKDKLLEESAEELLGEAEPWESWETKLVGGSIAIALVGVLILGWLINTFILD